MDTIIFDLGDVLFNWSADVALALLPMDSLRKLFHSDIWYEFERGQCTEQEAFHRLSDVLGVPEATIATALHLMRNTLRPSSLMFETVKALKGSGAKVYAMSNISQPDWELLQTKASSSEWELFDDFFTSWEAGSRKPEPEFYQSVLAKTGADPKQTVFVDDKEGNVRAAVELGITGVVFTDGDSVTRKLFELRGLASQ